MKKRIIKVKSEEQQKRLDVFVVENSFEGVSRNLVKNAINKGNIKVNGKIKKAHYTVKIGDEIEIDLDNLKEDRNEKDTLPENIHLDILYEDEDLIVINKPAGLIVHPTPTIKSGTLVNGLLYHIEDFKRSSQNPERLGIVHRLDKETSGVLVVAKNPITHHLLSKQFKERKTKKYYLTIVEGLLKEKEGEINLPLGRHPTLRQKRAVVYNGREAITEYKVLKEFDNLASLVWIRLKTGRTHQIRVHFKYLGNPVVGDSLYGKNKIEKNYGITADRQMLHALKLGLYHPTKKIFMEFLAPLHQDFKNLLIELSKK